MSRRLIAFMFTALLGAGLAACDDDDDPAEPAGPETFTATLRGTSEVPANTSPATGSFTLTVQPGGFNFTITTSGLTGTPSAAHIHGPAPVGVNASVIVGFFSANPPSGTLNGSGTITTFGTIGRDSLLALMRNGQTYVNVHSTPNFGGGEIRGQLVKQQ